MKYLIILIPMLSFSELSLQCELATNKSVEIHIGYMDGNATLTDSYNAVKYMQTTCKDNK